MSSCSCSRIAVEENSCRPMVIMSPALHRVAGAPAGRCGTCRCGCRGRRPGSRSAVRRSSAWLRELRRSLSTMSLSGPRPIRISAPAVCSAASRGTGRRLVPPACAACGALLRCCGTGGWTGICSVIVTTLNVTAGPSAAPRCTSPPSTAATNAAFSPATIRAVAAAEVAQEPAVVVPDHLGVPAGDQGALDHQVVGGVAADGHGVVGPHQRACRPRPRRRRSLRGR